MNAIADLLPHLSVSLNLVIGTLIIAGYVAIRQGRRERHRRLMLAAVGVGGLFLVSYLAQTLIRGHSRFPGDDWVRTAFVVILGTHTLLSVAVVPLVITTAVLGIRGRFPVHRRIARITFPIWLYVELTGVVIYWMNNHLRPPA